MRAKKYVTVTCSRTGECSSASCSMARAPAVGTTVGSWPHVVISSAAELCNFRGNVRIFQPLHNKVHQFVVKFK